MKPRSTGFTLVELMIVVLIASILVGISVPLYQTQVQHSRRTDAKTALLDAAVREEKYLTLNNSYTTTALNLGYTTLGIPIGSGYYNLYVCVGTAEAAATTPCVGWTTGASGATFVVSAVPVTGTSQAKDSSCLYYAVDNTGAQFAANSTAGTGTNTTSTCWQ